MKKETLKEILNRLDAIEKHLNINQKLTHEVGNWYGYKSHSGCIYMTNESSEHFNGYGVAGGSWHYNSDHWLKSSFNIKLTPEEAYERLKKWFIENGYKEGVKVRCLVSGVDFTLSEKPHPYLKKIINTGTFFAMSDSGIYICLMQNGNLAEIVEDEKPKVGDYAKFWNEESGGVEFGKVSIIKKGKYFTYDGNEYNFAKKITKEQYEQVKKYVIMEEKNFAKGDYVKVVDDDLIVFGIVLHTDYDHEYQKVSLKGCGWLPGKPTKITKEKYEQAKNM